MKMKFLALGLLCLICSSCSNGGGYVVGNGLVPENSFQEEAPANGMNKSCECAGEKNCPCAPEVKAKKKQSVKY